MNNSDFSPEGLAKLERYAEQFISGKLVYKRFSSREQYGCAAGGTSNVIASLLAGAKTDADKDAGRLASGLTGWIRFCLMCLGNKLPKGRGGTSEGDFYSEIIS